MELSAGLSELGKAGRVNWRHFALAWSLPILLNLIFVALSLHGPIRSSKLVWLDLGLFCVLMLAGVIGVVPYRLRRVTMRQTLFWILLVPVLVFVLLALLPFRFPITITGIPTVECLHCVHTAK